MALTTGYLQLNLVADQSGAALVRDPNLVAPWGVAVSPSGGDFWVADHGSGVVTNYGGDVSGTPFSRNSLVVAVPDGNPTGQAANGGSGFSISSGLASGPATFLMAGADGRISGWNQAVPLPVPSTQAQSALDSANSVYTGLTLADDGPQTLLYAANFHQGTVDVFDSTFAPETLPGGFVDPNLPAGFAPYNIANLGGQLYVTFAKQDAARQKAVAGAGGVVDVFDADGEFVKTLISGSVLDAPWGIARAPANFGDFSGALLVGNSGDGQIHAFNATNGNLLGALASPGGGAITIDGLRSIGFGNGLSAGDANALYFTAGPDDGQHGVFGAIRSAQSAALLASGVSFTAPLNASFNGLVATFADSTAALPAGSFTTMINWGDGASSPGTVTALGGGRYNLSGAHVYSQLGFHSLTATIQDSLSHFAVVSDAVNVKTPMLSATAGSLAATEDSAFSGVVASFADADGNLSPAAYQATIDWGDGTVSSGTVAANISGGFNVSGSHAYAEEGTWQAIVSIDDNDGDAIDATATVAVADADSLSAQALSVAATEGQSFSGAVASFTDANLLATAGDFAATIVWGDGATDAATVSGSNGLFSVSGSHVYAASGDYTFKAAIADPSPGTAAASATGTAHVADAALAATGFTFSAVEGQTFSRAIATFTDADPGAAAGKFSATIDWGDGATTNGSISAVGGGFQVTGSHAYAARSAGMTASVRIVDVGGGAVTASSLVIVADAPINVTAATVSGFEQTPLAGVVVATFTDAGTPLAPAAYAATIDWGDGAASSGTIIASGAGFKVTGSHVYGDEGAFPIAVSVAEIGGSSATAHGTANILEALLWDGSRGTANDRWINETYGDLLGRLADPGALGFWNAQLAAGTNRNAIADAIEASGEYRARQVQSLFERYLHRSADPGAQTYFVAQLAAGATYENLAAILIGSPEYFANRGHSDNDGFLDALFQDVLTRATDAGARAYFDKLLNGGAPRSQIAGILLGSDEYRQLLVQSYYEEFLNHSTTNGSTSFWLSFMRQGGRDEQVVAAIVGSDESFQKTAL
ncbi:MAG TPA: TIGR03118 family protein [Pirellulales bacterium]|nr:TIGR03118 family protein [Pirellulales bacterium]